MIIKIKVTKQEIRTYTSTNDIRSYNYDEEFLKTILGQTNKYEISDKNANVTWYSLNLQQQLTIVEDEISSHIDQTGNGNDLIPTEQEEEDMINELLEEGNASWGDFFAEEDVQGVEAIEVLESEDYDITDAAKEAIIENFYNLQELKEIAKDKKITGRNIKKLEK